MKLPSIVKMCFYLATFFLMPVHLHAHVTYNPLKNKIELSKEIEKASNAFSPAVSVFNLVKPFDGLTLIIETPGHIVVNKEFTITYTIKAHKPAALLSWDDLLPNDSSLELISMSEPSIGGIKTVMDAQNITTRWIFNKGFEAGGIYSWKATFVPYAQGIIQYCTKIAANPPSLCGPISLVINNN